VGKAPEGISQPVYPAAGGPGSVHTITGAQRALSDEQSGRTRKYLVSMGIRTACVLAAIVVPGWPRWVFIAGAVILPYLAVVVANAGRSNDEPGQTEVISSGVGMPLSRALPPGRPNA